MIHRTPKKRRKVLPFIFFSLGQKQFGAKSNPTRGLQNNTQWAFFLYLSLTEFMSDSSHIQSFLIGAEYRNCC